MSKVENDSQSVSSKSSQKVDTLKNVYEDRKKGYILSNEHLADWRMGVQKGRVEARTAILSAISTLLDHIELNSAYKVKFMIGKTGVHARRNRTFDPNIVSTWRAGGTSEASLGSRWTDYKKKGFDALIPLVAITRERVPVDLYPVISQERYAFDLEEDLIAICKTEDFKDACLNPKIYNRGGSSTTSCVAYLLYIAIKLVAPDMPPGEEPLERLKDDFEKDLNPIAENSNYIVPPTKGDQQPPEPVD